MWNYVAESSLFKQTIIIDLIWAHITLNLGRLTCGVKALVT